MPQILNPFMPTGAFNICCPRDCVSRHNGSEITIDSEGYKGGTRGAPVMPRDAVSRTANVERTGRHKWVKYLWYGSPRNVFNMRTPLPKENFYKTVNANLFIETN